MITEKKLYNVYNYMISIAKDFAEKNAELSLDCIKIASVIAKNYYLCYRDDRLETLIRKISISELNIVEILPIKNSYIFYDTHSTDNVTLTEQYLSALIAWNVEFVYITTKPLSRNNASHIRSLIQNSKKGSFEEIPGNLNYLETARALIDIVKRYKPEKAFIHTTTYDVSGIAAWASISGVERYYIDLSDHTFWLGADVFDYYITFRNYGYNICIQKRKIDKRKVFIQPFYPITNSKPFHDLPSKTDESIKILSGGRLEKIYGQDDMYFRIICEILKLKKIEIFFSGGGDYGKLGQTFYIKKQIKRFEIDDSFHMLGFRDDIIEVMKHVDIYVGTFPIGGGLMTQIAASQGLPVVQYASKGLSDRTGEFIQSEGGLEDFVFCNDFDGFMHEIQMLAADKKYRLAKGAKLQKSVLTEQQFREQLKDIVDSKICVHAPLEYEVDCIELRDNQIDVENHCQHNLPRILLRSVYLKKHRPFTFLKNAFLFFCYTDKKWIIHKIIKR